MKLENLMRECGQLDAQKFNAFMQNSSLDLASRVNLARSLAENADHHAWERCIAICSIAYRGMLENRRYFGLAERLLSKAHEIAESSPHRTERVRWHSSLLAARVYLHAISNEGSLNVMTSEIKRAEEMIGMIWFHLPSALNICRCLTIDAVLKFLEGRHQEAAGVLREVPAIALGAIGGYEIVTIHHAHEVKDLANIVLVSQTLLEATKAVKGEPSEVSFPAKPSFYGVFGSVMLAIDSRYRRTKWKIWK